MLVTAPNRRSSLHCKKYVQNDHSMAIIFYIFFVFGERPESQRKFLALVTEVSVRHEIACRGGQAGGMVRAGRHAWGWGGVP